MKPLTRRLRRVLFLIPYVSRHREGVPLAELASVLGVTTRALERELTELTLVGMPDGGPHDFIDIHIDGRGAAARVVVAPRRLLLRPLRLTAAEAYALLLGASALRRTGIPSFDDALSRADEKVRALLRKSGADDTAPPTIVFDPVGRERPDHLTVVSRASRDRRAVELDYASLAGQRRKKVIVEPYALLNHRGAWYVLGKSITHAENRIFVFKVERILGAKVLDRPFTVPTDFDVREYTGGRLFIAGLSPVEVKLRLRGAAAKRMGGWYKHAKQERGGAIVVRTKEVLTGWLAAWILRQGPQVEVVSPPQLASWVRALARRAADAHEEFVSTQPPADVASREGS